MLGNKSLKKQKKYKIARLNRQNSRVAIFFEEAQSSNVENNNYRVQ